jgi:class 3 adenylate cyclase
MTFDEILTQVVELLQREGRVAYRILKRRLDLSDDDLEDLKADLIDAKRMAADEGGKVLVWVGDPSVAGNQFPVANSSQPPAPQTSDSGLRTPDSKPQTLDPRPGAGERRQLTVQFIDLVGSTTLSQQLDPEDYHARVVAYQTACQQVIARYEGHIAQYLGDGVLVYFGYPIAHEDDAVRAVHSGLEIVAAVRQLAYTPPLQVRIGIHTGLVVVGEIGNSGKRETLALGETPNLAARLQALAEPNTVVISAATQRLIGELFTCRSLGLHEPKGLSVPLEVYQVLAEGELQSRFEVAGRLNSPGRSRAGSKPVARSLGASQSR